MELLDADSEVVACRGPGREEGLLDGLWPSPSHVNAVLYGEDADLGAVAMAAVAGARLLMPSTTSSTTSVAGFGQAWMVADLLARWDSQTARGRIGYRFGDPPRPPNPSGCRKATVSSRLSALVFRRDGYRCCYCQIPVVTQWMNGDIPKLVTHFPEATPGIRVANGCLVGSGKGGALCNRDAAKWLWIIAAADHVFPASGGGDSSMENLVTSCGGCNYSKTAWTLEQLRVRDPRIHRDG